MNELDLCL